MRTGIASLFRPPQREWIIIGLVGVALVFHLALPGLDRILLLVAIVGTLPLAVRALRDIRHLRISIDVFNLFALGVSYATREFPSAAFIILMITSADLLDWHTIAQTKHAVARLLGMKPQMAMREQHGQLVDVPAEHLRKGDVVVVNSGAMVPADGIIVSGSAHVNEALVSGESQPILRGPGDRAVVATVVDTGVIKVQVTHVGKESTLERMAQLMRQAAENKSRPERLADRFATIFLPFVLLIGLGVWLTSHDLTKTAALFLVACADDMAVAIPLAMTASLGWAARRGVIIKGGVWLDALAHVRTVVLDKTGTLTYGTFRIDQVSLSPGTHEHRFWTLVGAAEKFSEHPVGRALARHAAQHVGAIPDPDGFTVYKGMGVRATLGGDTIIIGQRPLFVQLNITIDSAIADISQEATIYATVNNLFAGRVTIGDVPRAEATAALKDIRDAGVADIVMFTGDTEAVAARVAAQLGITRYVAAMTPELKLARLEKIPHRPVAMVGDGINDAPALARADVGIAMGGQGTAIAAEAADVVILNDNLQRVAEIIRLGKRTLSIVRWDIVIWAASNVVGFWLVLSGRAGPVFAAFYNFATDFLPLINSARLFRGRA